MRHAIKGIFAIILLSLAFDAAAQPYIFNKYEPANGIQKSDGTTYQNTAAVSADIRGLWTGTCDATTFLRGDGACFTPAGTGITFSMPSGFSVAGSPGTSISVTTALNGVLKGNGSGFTTAVAADIYGLWTGSCSSTTFLRGDGSCQTPSGTVSPGGSSGQFQYNNSGAFGGTSNVTWISNGNMTIAAPTSVSASSALNVSAKSGSGASGQGAILANGTSDTPAFISHQAGTIGLLLNSAGSNFGTIVNRNSTTWGLGYVSTASTLGTDVIEWTDSGTVLVSGSFNASTDVQAGGVSVCRSDGTNCPGTAIVCTTACSGASMVVGQTLTLVKGTSTSRSSTTSVSVDPDLQITSLPTGVYEYDVNIYVSAGGNSGGYKVQMASASGCGLGVQAQGWWTFGDTPSLIIVNAATNAATTIAAASGYLHSHGTLYDTAVEICWAQNASNGTATTVQGGSGGGSFPSVISITRLK